MSFYLEENWIKLSVRRGQNKEFVSDLMVDDHNYVYLL